MTLLYARHLCCTTPLLRPLVALVLNRRAIVQQFPTSRSPSPFLLRIYYGLYSLILSSSHPLGFYCMAHMTALVVHPQLSLAQGGRRCQCVFCPILFNFTSGKIYRCSVIAKDLNTCNKLTHIKFRQEHT